MTDLNDYNKKEDKKIKSIEQTYEERGFVNLKGKWCAPFKVLLNSAHEKYKDKFSIKTKMIEVNHEEKYAIFVAHVITEDQIFTGYGDAFKHNTGVLVQNAYIRMAETRAIVRALRFATNIAEVGTDEL